MKNILFPTIVATLFSCNSKTAEQPAAEEATNNIVTLNAAQLKSAGIETGTPVQKNIASVIKLNGIIDVPPQNMVSISMPLGGYLKSTKLLPGMYVKKGEVIATMEDQQYIQLQQDYLTAKSKLDFIQAEYDRQKELNQSQASSDKVFQQTQMELNTTKINIRALAEKLSLIHINPDRLSENMLSKSVSIYSPIDGFVSRVNVNIGKYVNPADILFELVNPTDIHLNLKVYEKDLNKLAVGQKVIAYTNNEPEKKHLCEIILISRDLSSDRTAELHCHFEEYDKTLLPGMYMNAEIAVTSNNAAAIPEDAVVMSEGQSYIFEAIGADKFQMTAAETGVKENGFIELKNADLFKDKKLVTKGAYTLLMTLKNKPEE